jgi:peptide/nickel transport system ATP-binding protein
MKDQAILKVENLKTYFPVRKNLVKTIFSRKKREYVRAVDDVSFNVGEGDILGIVGESGCGKSTMGRTILRLIEPTAGKIYYEDIDVTSLSRKKMRKLRRKMQMIFQDPHGSLNPRRTVADILRQSVRIHRLADGKAEEDAMIKNTLEEVGLKPPGEFWGRYPVLLSGGQRQRVGVGRILILQPKLVVADEPVSMLDVSVRMGIIELLAQLREKFGISLIYITHDLATARYICDRIAIMYLGKIVEVAPTEELLKTPLHPYAQALIAAVPVPDPRVEMKELPIIGYVPLIPSDVYTSCRFYPRCPYADKECREQDPPLVEVSPGHSVACIKIK